MPRRWAPVLAAALTASVIVTLAPTTADAAGWTHPFRIAGPIALDLIPPQIAFSADGSAAVAFGAQDIDQPRRSTAYLTTRSPKGRLARQRRVPEAQQVLDLAYEGSALELITGTSPRKYGCCSSAAAIRFARGSFGGSQRLVGGLAGATAARLVVLSARVLAAIATERGVWAAEATSGAAFGTIRRVDTGKDLPESLAAAAGSGNQGVLAWTARASQYGAPRSVSIASGFPLHAASRAITVPAGHRIDELALVPAASGVTVAWIESWFDGFGRYHSAAMVADLLTRARRTVSSSSALASGLAFAADAGGAQTLAWRECDSAGACVAKVALRGARGRFRRAEELGAIDPGQAPAAAVGPHGNTVLGWIDGGQVHAAAARAGRGGVGASTLLSGAPYAADLALAYGPRGQALAAWTEGTFEQSVMGAAYR